MLGCCKRCESVEGFADYLRDQKCPFAEPHSAAAVANVYPERNASRVDLPEAKCSCFRDYTTGMSSRTVRSQEIPGQDAFGLQSAPSQIAIGALPVVTKI